ncbi:MAG: LysR family transcriptional regulator [Crenarchaeota archaeon]|nr:LysR family transcriptional regulator [Thermoproteota archaeon]
MPDYKKHNPSCKFWIECNGKPVIGKGGAEILNEINIEKSLTKAAEKLGMSYRYIWNYIRRTEKNLGEAIVSTHKGGKVGGGGTELTSLGKSLLLEYKQLEDYLSGVLSETKISNTKTNKSVEQNSINGKVVSIEKGVLTSKIRIEISVPTTIIAINKKEIVNNIDLKLGDQVQAIIKSTEIFIEKIE